MFYKNIGCGLANSTFLGFLDFFNLTGPLSTIVSEVANWNVLVKSKGFDI